MNELEWTYKPVDKKRVPDYEFAYMKAALEDKPNERAFHAYEAMFGEEPKSGTPYWLVRLACYYGGLSLGHKRVGRPMSGTDKAMFYMVSRLDEKEFRNNKVLWHHMYLHDVEDAEFGGRELVEKVLTPQSVQNSPKTL